jgi:ribosomal protein S18
MGAWPVRVQARDARASAMAQRRRAMAVAPKKRPPVTISGRSRAGSGITMKVHHAPLAGQLSLRCICNIPAGQVPTICIWLHNTPLVTWRCLVCVPSWIRLSCLLVQTLIDEGLLWPGEDVLSVDYKQQQTLATLTADGKIASSSKRACLCAMTQRMLPTPEWLRRLHHGGWATLSCHEPTSVSYHAAVGGGYREFESPSAFSIFLKRLVNPDRKADDGWKTVKFGGKCVTLSPS